MDMADLADMMSRECGPIVSSAPCSSVLLYADVHTHINEYLRTVTKEGAETPTAPSSRSQRKFSTTGTILRHMEISLVLRILLLENTEQRLSKLTTRNISNWVMNEQ